ncbi:hypothetical protein JWG39_06440 [Desulforhopalus vacuolatus]|uniref:5'/3'-nucleotidase SurE n=1 Tax=Desulforhopalus vacuolatus TaxID=40414 RepID=UPI0019647E56|nr:5'/3'-nucleotidase SurE [Desulforhopalus vacuolatus]MBM9519457.1 hypothetical protein [Desulforhopalus vacuolatus]
MTTILITSDEGLHTPRFAAFEAAMTTPGNTVIVIPNRNNFAASLSLTINRPLNLTRHGAARYNVNSIAADCVVSSLSKVLREPPALVVSDFNLEPDLGDNITCSGTVSTSSTPATNFSAFFGNSGGFDD